MWEFRMEPGKIIGINYQLTRPLGPGGMGDAWLARSSGPRSEVVVKFIKKELVHDAELRRRFEREARIQSALQVPNVVQILDGDFSVPVPFIVTEYCRSGELAHVFSTASFSETVQAFFQVMQGLAYAHEKGVVHRDLKPTNILVHESGLVKLADFGLAKLMKRDTTTLTATGWGLGTVGYMAPEQWSAAKHVDERADIYSLGVIVAELMTQVAPPFTKYEVRDALRHRFPKLGQGPESRVVEVVIRSTARDPDRRYGSIRELMETWQELLPARPELAKIAEPSWSRGLRELTAKDFDTLIRVVSGDLTEAEYAGYGYGDQGDVVILSKLAKMGLVCGVEYDGDSSASPGGIDSVAPTQAGRALCTALTALGENWSQIGQFLDSKGHRGS